MRGRAGGRRTPARYTAAAPLAAPAAPTGRCCPQSPCPCRHRLQLSNTHLGDQRVLAPWQLGQQAGGQFLLLAFGARPLFLASTCCGATPTMLAGRSGRRLGKRAAGRHIGAGDVDGGGGQRRTDVGCGCGCAGASDTDPPRLARCGRYYRSRCEGSGVQRGWVRAGDSGLGGRPGAGGR